MVAVHRDHLRDHSKYQRANGSGEINPFNGYGRTKFEAEKKLRNWKEKGDNSLIIVRQTVIFGEGSLGNVFNLLNQMASRKFVTVGMGGTKKSMAYIINFVALSETCATTDLKYGVHNLINLLALMINEHVSLVLSKLNGEIGVGRRLPYFLGMIVGYVADDLAKLTGKNCV